MFEEKNIDTLRPGLTPFPEHVFVDDQPWLADQLWPLLSIDLGLLRPELAGTVVHMLRPVGPVDGCIGDCGWDDHTAYTAPNWFALHLTKENRYRFLGKEEYFETYDAAYAANLAAYQAKVRAYARKHGRLADFPEYLDGEVRERKWLDVLGGDFWAGNWLTPPPPPAFTCAYDEDTDHIELTCGGKPFFPVACADGLTILMFYEPESRTVLFTFDET